MKEDTPENRKAMDEEYERYFRERMSNRNVSTANTLSGDWLLVLSALALMGMSLYLGRPPLAWNLFLASLMSSALGFWLSGKSWDDRDSRLDAWMESWWSDEKLDRKPGIWSRAALVANIATLALFLAGAVCLFR